MIPLNIRMFPDMIHKKNLEYRVAIFKKAIYLIQIPK